MATREQITLLEDCLSGFLEDALASNDLNSYQLDPLSWTGNSQQLMQPSASFDVEIARFFKQQAQIAPQRNFSQKTLPGGALPKLSPVRLGRSTSFEGELQLPGFEIAPRKQAPQPLAEPNLAPLRLNSLELLEIHHSFLDDGKEALPLTELFWDDVPSAMVTIHSGETPAAKRVKHSIQITANTEAIPSQPVKYTFPPPEPGMISEMAAGLDLASIGSLGFSTSFSWDPFQDGLGIASMSPLQSLRLQHAEEIVPTQPNITDVHMNQCNEIPQAEALPQGLICEEELEPHPEQQLQQKQLWPTPVSAPVPVPEEIIACSPEVERPRQPRVPTSVVPRKAGRKRLPVDHITLESLQEQGLFDVPIQAAAQELGVGLSVLKRICRQIGLARWPFRTRQSLRGVIAKTEQYLTEDATGDAQKADVVDALQKTLDGLQGEAGQGLSDSVRKYRQSVFKLNYKIKKNAGKSQAKVAAQPAIPATAAARMAASSSRPLPSAEFHGTLEEDGMAFDDTVLAPDFKMKEEEWLPCGMYPVGS